MSRVAAFPDPQSLARDELTSLLQELTSREEVVPSRVAGLARPRATWSSLALTISTPDRRASESLAT